MWCVVLVLWSMVEWKTMASCGAMAMRWSGDTDIADSKNKFNLIDEERKPGWFSPKKTLPQDTPAFFMMLLYASCLTLRLGNPCEPFTSLNLSGGEERRNETKIMFNSNSKSTQRSR